LFWPAVILVAIGGITFAVAGKPTSSRVMQQIAPPVLIFTAIYIIVVSAYLLGRARRMGNRYSDQD